MSSLYFRSHSFTEKRSRECAVRYISLWSITLIHKDKCLISICFKSINRKCLIRVHSFIERSMHTAAYLRHRACVCYWRRVWHRPRYCGLSTRLLGQSRLWLKLMLVRMQRWCSGWVGRMLSPILRKIWDGWFWLRRRRDCIWRDIGEVIKC